MGTIDTAAATIRKWNTEDPSSPTRFISVFLERRPEAYQLLASVSHLHDLMTFLILNFPLQLPQSQTLMHIAMKRLQYELYRILSSNQNPLSTSDLRAVAHCMFTCGYVKECANLYQITRKSFVDEAIYKLGIHQSKPSKFNQLQWEAVDLQITKWLRALASATSSLFPAERLLCDRVFAFSGAARNSSCFLQIAGNAAHLLLQFPELVAKSRKSSPEKIFRVLDMYTAIGDLLPEIEAIFHDSGDAIRSRAVASMLLLGESVRVSVSEHERSIEKSRLPVPETGGVHELTVRLMSFLTILSDYGHVITTIFSEPPPPDSCSARISSLVFVLLCKLDLMARQYGHVSLSYLFLANNLCHVVYKARTSSNLGFLLGEQWMEEHESKARQFAGSYERFMWWPVLASLQPPGDDDDDPTAPDEQAFTRFESLFEDACGRQGGWVVSDRSLRDEIAGSIRNNLVPAYRELYESCKRDVVAKYAPEELDSALSELFLGEDRTDLYPN